MSCLPVRRHVARASFPPSRKDAVGKGGFIHGGAEYTEIRSWTPGGTLAPWLNVVLQTGPNDWFGPVASEATVGVDYRLYEIALRTPVPWPLSSISGSGHRAPGQEYVLEHADGIGGDSVAPTVQSKPPNNSWWSESPWTKAVPPSSASAGSMEGREQPSPRSGRSFRGTRLSHAAQKRPVTELVSVPGRDRPHPELTELTEDCVPQDPAGSVTPRPAWVPRFFRE